MEKPKIFSNSSWNTTGVGLPSFVQASVCKRVYAKIGDISELADLLGHTRLETTWIYTKTTSEEKRVRLEHLDL